MRQLISRYGPKGTFWTQNPTVPKVPIRSWQLWNEQMAPWFWDSKPWARSYTKMLKAAYRAIHKADRKAKVVAGSFVGRRRLHPVGGIRDLYRAGAKGYFDQIAVHPFTNDAKSVKDTIWRMLEIVRRVRTQMRKHHDGRKPIILTELTWPAAVGKVPKSRLLGLETTPKGQVKRLKAAYKQAGEGRAQDAHHAGLLVRVGHALRRQHPAVGRLLSLRGAQPLRRRGVLAACRCCKTYYESRREVRGLP